MRENRVPKNTGTRHTYMAETTRAWSVVPTSVTVVHELAHTY